MQTYLLKKESEYLKKCFHRVSGKETLFDIAGEYNTTPHLIARENNLKGEVSAGDILVITMRTGRLYTVKEGDTLKSISVIHGMSEEEIMQKNDLKFIYTGLTLLL